MTDWTALLRDPPADLTLTLTAGHEHAPDDPFGREQLTVAADGGLTLAWAHWGQSGRCTGRVEPALARRLLAALADSPFPTLPLPLAPPGPGSVQHLAVRAGGAEASALLITPLEQQPPFDVVCGLAGSFCAQLRGRTGPWSDPAPGAVADVRRE